MADVAGQPFFSGEIVVVLRNRGFKHRGTKIRSIAQALGVRIVREKAEAVSVTPPSVDISGVVPTMSGVRQQVDGAHGRAKRARRASGWWRRRNAYGGWQ